MSSNALTAISQTTDLTDTQDNSQQQFVTMRLGEQWFGISVLTVQDILRNLDVSNIPLASPAIIGAMNIRGRVVTAIDMRKRLDISSAETTDETMYVVVECEQELFALVVDAVGDVLTLSTRDIEQVPSNFDPRWREISSSVFKLEGKLMVIIDVAQIIDGINK